MKVSTKDIKEIVEEIINEEITKSNPLLEDKESIMELISGKRDRVIMYNLNKELQMLLSSENLSIEGKMKAIENYIFIMKEVQDYIRYALMTVGKSFDKLKEAKEKKEAKEPAKTKEDNSIYNIFLDATNETIILDKNYFNYKHHKEIGVKVYKIYASRSYFEAYHTFVDMEFPPTWNKLVLTTNEPKQEEVKQEEAKQEEAIYNIFLDRTHQQVVLDKNFFHFEKRKKANCRLSKLCKFNGLFDATAVFMNLELDEGWEKLDLTSKTPN